MMIFIKFKCKACNTEIDSSQLFKSEIKEINKITFNINTDHDCKTLDIEVASLELSIFGMK